MVEFLEFLASEGLKNFLVGVGTVAAGFGTLGIAYAAAKTIPEKLSQRYKDKELVTLYQKVVFRMYRKVEASPNGMAFALPEDLEQLTTLLLEHFPQVGTREDADRLMDDLMLDDYFKSVQGNATVVKTARWNPKNRSKVVPPKVEDLPPNGE